MSIKDGKLDTTKIGKVSDAQVKEVGRVKIYLNKLLGKGATAEVFEGVYTYDKERINVSNDSTKKSTSKPKKIKVAVKCIPKKKVEELPNFQ
mgnify:CR=1 FL=1